MLHPNDVRVLRAAGFISHEIDQLHNAKNPDGSGQHINLESEAWKAALQSRRDWINARRRDGWSDNRIRDALDGYYRVAADKTRSPFDFLKKEYAPPHRITDYQVARQKRAERKIASLGSTYRRRW